MRSDRNPAAAASIEPTTNVKLITRSTLMPIRLALRVLKLTARIAAPNLVPKISHCIAIMSAAAVPITATSAIRTDTPIIEKSSVESISDAPFIGHGTGSIREAFQKTAVGQGASAVVPVNPHNQTFAVAIQLGCVGAALLFASDAGKHITGQTLAVDGGVSAVTGG